MGLLSNRVGLLSNGVGLLSGERVLENTPTPLFEQPLKFIAHGRIFKSLIFVTYTYSIVYLYAVAEGEALCITFCVQ